VGGMVDKPEQLPWASMGRKLQHKNGQEKRNFFGRNCWGQVKGGKLRICNPRLPQGARRWGKKKMCGQTQRPEKFLVQRRVRAKGKRDGDKNLQGIKEKNH